MTSFSMVLTLTASLVLPSSAGPFGTPAPPAAQQIACELLSQAQINQATGATVGAGSAISAPTSCQWAGQGKIVTLTITQTRAGKSPLDQFNAGKNSTLPGVTVESVTGVGDDAYYVLYSGTTRAGCGLVVKKGSSSFEIRVYGFDLAQAKPVAKTLAIAAAAKF
jgi:hypothetical protein